MNLTPQAIAREVAATGFSAGLLEKVFRLMALLDALSSHPFLKTRIALKGGTALNLFHFDVPRLSVDIERKYFRRHTCATAVSKAIISRTRFEISSVSA